MDKTKMDQIDKERIIMNVRLNLFNASILFILLIVKILEISVK